MHARNGLCVDSNVDSSVDPSVDSNVDSSDLNDRWGYPECWPPPGSTFVMVGRSLFGVGCDGWGPLSYQWVDGIGVEVRVVVVCVVKRQSSCRPCNCRLPAKL